MAIFHHRAYFVITGIFMFKIIRSNRRYLQLVSCLGVCTLLVSSLPAHAAGYDGAPGQGAVGDNGAIGGSGGGAEGAHFLGGGQGGSSASSAGGYGNGHGDGGNGADGSSGTPGGAGSTAFYPGGDSNILNNKTNAGGLGIGSSAGVPGSGGGGGAGLVTGYVPHFDNFGIIEGGHGGAPGSGVGAANGGGGAGIWILGLSMTNHGEVAGGFGSGASGAYGGGGAGVVLANNQALFVNAKGASVSGGVGASSAIHPENSQSNSGAGVVLAGNGQTVINMGSIKGGGLGERSAAGPGIISYGSDNIIELQVGSITYAGLKPLAGMRPGEGVVTLGDNTKVIVAGLAGNAGKLSDLTTANAIAIYGNDSTLELRSTYEIIGNVFSGGLRNALALGGADNQTFNLASLVDADDPNAATNGLFRGFDIFKKIGASTWTVSGTQGAKSPWSIEEGTLALGGDANLENSRMVFVGRQGALDATAISGTGTTLQALAGEAGGQVLLGSKTLTLRNSLGAADAGNFGGTISGSGGVTLASGYQIFSGQNSYTGGTIVQGGTFQLGDGINTGSIAGGVDVRAGGTLAFAAPNGAGPVVFNGVISGDGDVRNLVGYTSLTGSNTYSGKTVIQGGTLEAGNGSALGNTSEVQINQGGVLSLAPTLSNLDVKSVTNLGSIIFQGNGGAGYKSLNVTGDYTGGGQIVLNTVLNLGGSLDQQTTDRVLIHGNVGGSPTLLQLKTTGDGGNTNVAQNNAYMPTEGISLVQISGASGNGAFQLAGGYASAGGANPYQYRLFAYGPGQPAAPDSSQSKLGSDPLTWDYRLQTSYIDEHGNVVPGQPENGHQALVPQASAYLSAGLAMQSFGTTVMDNLHRRLGEIRRTDALQGSPANVETFARYIGSNGNYVSNLDSADYGTDFHQNTQALQIGGNWLVSNRDDQRLRLGVAGTFGTSEVTPTANEIEQSKLTVNGRSLSLIGTWTHKDGWYVDGIMAGALYTGPVRTAERGKVTSLRGSSFGASLEAGKTMALSGAFLIEPQVQVIAQTLRMNDATDVDGVTAEFKASTSWTGRVGVRVAYDVDGAQQFTPYGRMSLLHTEGGPKSVELSSQAFKVGRSGTAMQLSMGASGMITPRFAAYGELGVQRRIGSYGFNNVDVTAGLRYLF